MKYHTRSMCLLAYVRTTNEYICWISVRECVYMCACVCVWLCDVQVIYLFSKMMKWITSSREPQSRTEKNTKYTHSNALPIYTEESTKEWLKQKLTNRTNVVTVINEMYICTLDFRLVWHFVVSHSRTINIFVCCTQFQSQPVHINTFRFFRLLHFFLTVACSSVANFFPSIPVEVANCVSFEYFLFQFWLKELNEKLFPNHFIATTII